jgi:nicotinamidase-related amidase
MKQRRISNSPLIDPSACVLVLISPHPGELASIITKNRNGHQRTLAAVTQAADIANVPIFVLSREFQGQKASPGADTPGTSSPRQFAFGEYCSPWSHKGFVDALAAEDRSILLLAGYWLEHQILATALHALVESYDVYVLLDATPARSRHASEPARDRLNQAGATPVVASQIIHEWSAETPDPLQRTALLSLLPAIMEVE